ncbi:hypothetical protein ACLMJK_001883 [Lecanora helva]
MAEDFAELVCEGVPLAAEHYEKVYDPIKDKTKQGIDKVKGMRNNRNGNYDSDDDYDDYDRYGPPRRSHTDRRRRSPPDDYRPRPRSGRDDVVEERYAYSKGNGRAKSMGGGRPRGSRRNYSDSESSLSPPRRERRKSLGEKALVALGLGGAAGAEAEKGKRDRRRRSRARSDRRRGSTPSSDSEGYYVRKSNRSRGPPANGGAYYDERTPDRYRPAGYIRDRDDRDGSRGGQELARRDNQTSVSSRTNGAFDEHRGQKRDSSSSSSSSDVCSSSEDERRTKKMKGKEYLTAGLAAVATIHAAHGVYSSMEARDKRHLEVLKGEMSPEEARKKKNKARIQDAAAIGIAALGIKGAYSEWQEVQENRQELAEQKEERQKRHEKRVRKMEKRRNGESQYGRSRSEGPSRRDRDYSR